MKRPSKKSKAVDLYLSGVPTILIGKMLSSPPGAIRVMISRARKEGAIPPSASMVGRAFEVHVHRADRLSEEAERRGATPAELLEVIIHRVIEDNLVGAIIDD